MDNPECYRTDSENILRAIDLRFAKKVEFVSSVASLVLRESFDGGNAMSRVRVLVGTAKGAFILSSDEKREKWEIEGPLFAGWTIYHMKGSPIDPNRIYASQCSDWFGQIIQRSDDGGRTWQQPGCEPTPELGAMPAVASNKFVYECNAGTHMWYDGTPHPWEFKRVWHLEPSHTDVDIVYAGVEDAAIFLVERRRVARNGNLGLVASGSIRFCSIRAIRNESMWPYQRRARSEPTTVEPLGSPSIAA